MTPSAPSPDLPETPVQPPPRRGWHAFTAGAMRLFHQYGNWLVSISWKRFFLLAILLLIATAILQHLPPFSYTIGSVAHDVPEVVVLPPTPPKPPTVPVPPGRREPAIKIEKKDPQGRDVVISIDRDGVRITPNLRGATGASAPASTAPSTGASAPASSASLPHANLDGSVEIKLPPGADSEEVREAVEEARAAVVEAIRESQEKIAEAAQEAAEERSAERDAGARRRRAQHQAHPRAPLRRLPDPARLARHHRLGDPEDHLQGPEARRGEGRGRDRDRRVGAAQAASRRGAHGGDAGAGRAAFPVQHAGLDRPSDRNRSAACEPDAEKPDRAAARLDAVDARIEPGRAHARPRDGGDPAVPRDPQGADGRPAAGGDPRAEGPALGRVPVDDDPVAGRERDQARPRAEGRRRRAHRRGRDRRRAARRHRRRHRPRLRPRRHGRHRRRPGEHPRAAEASVRRPRDRWWSPTISRPERSSP